jgi:hypothetical protein
MLGKLKSMFGDLSTSVCCFCGHAIAGELQQDVVLPQADGAVQHLAAHGSCLQSRLHPDVPYLTPKELEDDV